MKILGGLSYVYLHWSQVVNVFMLWTILTLVSWSGMGLLQAVVFLGVCSGVITLEVILGIVRVQDYFKSK